MRQPKTRGEPLSSVAPVLALQPLEPGCARHGGNAIVVARIGYLRSRPSSAFSISASVIGDNSPRVWALLISLESTCQDGSSTFE
jgi:hypothetical protein